jgi:hypothetical protein
MARQMGLTEIAPRTLGEGVEYEPYEAPRRFYFSREFRVYQWSSTDNPGCRAEIRIRKDIGYPGPLEDL